MSKAPTATSETPPKVKSPLKTRQESLGYFFGQALESFDKLLQLQSPTSTASANEINVKPRDLDIIRHWMYQEDQNRTSKRNSDSSAVIGIVTDNLIEFYTKYHPSVELR